MFVIYVLKGKLVTLIVFGLNILTLFMTYVNDRNCMLMTFAFRNILMVIKYEKAAKFQQ